MSVQNFSLKTSPHFVERLWDLICCLSIIGIWPRFIEPSLLCTTRHTLALPDLPNAFEGLRIVHISDLHYSSHTTERFLQRIQQNIEHLQPHIIFFTGDLLTYSELDDTGEKLLKKFLLSLKAPLGIFAVLGNHDYSQYVSLSEDGNVRQIQEHIPTLIAGFSRLFGINKKNSNDPLVQEPIPEHTRLIDLYRSTNVRLLQNETEQIGIGNNRLNITGLGDIMAKQCDPNTAFINNDFRMPTIVLSHNPDSLPFLKSYPGDLYLFGHTHGGQVNLPFIWKKITPLINKRLKSGLIHEDGRYLFINRGLGATLPFRWFAPPEIALFTSTKSGAKRIPVWQKHFSFEKKPALAPQ